MAEIEKESLEKTGLRSDVVTLYQGGQYHLYRYKKLHRRPPGLRPGAADRLLRRRSGQLRVSALRPRHLLLPRLRERQAGQDRALPEVEQGRRARTTNWSSSPAIPGRTDRLNTVAELEYLRDIGFPFLLQRLNRLEVLLPVYSGRSEENARQAKEAALRRRRTAARPAIGGLAGLLDPAIMAQEEAEEKKLRDGRRRRPEAEGRRRRLGHDRRGRRRSARPTSKRYTMLEGGAGFNSAAVRHRPHLVRAAEERPKPNGERLRGIPRLATWNR